MLLLTGTEANPLHTLILLAVVTKPLLDALYIQDLRKIDPFNTILQSKKAGHEDDLLPRGGLSSQSKKGEIR